MCFIPVSVLKFMVKCYAWKYRETGLRYITLHLDKIISRILVHSTGCLILVFILSNKLYDYLTKMEEETDILASRLAVIWL